MTVKQLIDRLQQLPPEADVWIEQRGEHRRLEPTDVQHRPQTSIYDADEGVVSDEKNVVIFSTWA